MPIAISKSALNLALHKKILPLGLSAMLICASTGYALQIGAWVGGSGSTPQPTQANVDAFEAMQGRKLDLISLFVIWDVNNWAFTKTYADIAEQNGSILVVTWMPNGYAAPRIVAGNADAYIKKYAQDVKAYGKEIWLRPLHEANGDWYDWGIAKAGAGNTNQNLIEAWQRIVKIFRDEGVTNVKWVWTTNATNSGSASFIGHYPGDAWVDMISIDGYNWGTAQSWSKWETFEQVFTPSYNALKNINKPLFLPEFSSSEHGGNKAQWIKDMFAALPTKFPKIFALMWFSQTKSAEADWAVNTSDAALNAWKEGIAAASTSLGSARQDGLGEVKASSQGLEITLRSTESVEVRFIDAKGSLVEKRELGHLAAGIHRIESPKSAKALAYQARIGDRFYSADLAVR